MRSAATTKRHQTQALPSAAPTTAPLPARARVASLFTGIGGIELGLHRAGFEPDGLRLACEIDPGARAILATRFGARPRLHQDVQELIALDGADLVTAGFPCQDLSQAGLTEGIGGPKSGLVNEVFRLLAASKRKGKAPRWVLFENVPFMLRLQSGRAMRRVVAGFEELGYRWWAYRVLDAIHFGLPQRRRRVFFLASRSPDDDPRSVLFDPPAPIGKPRVLEHVDPERAKCFGFYWTEGNRGLGWATEALPTLKGGSGLGIPSPPAIWFRDTDEFVTPGIELAERVQGFPPGWTSVESVDFKENARWLYVGNAVPVAVAEWVGKRLLAPVTVADGGIQFDTAEHGSWPNAAYGRDGEAFEAREQLEGPPESRRQLLSKLPILTREKRARHVRPLSIRAAQGVYTRLLRAQEEGRLRPREDFMAALRKYVETHPERRLLPKSARSSASRR
ncbi:MAG: DNA cytosine methyltransferase [Planctomycetes bacterium]|nr:DNA cytosine methyltransferase [Planctomycetota bacterium]